MALVDPHAIVDASARLADDVEIGPFSVIGPGVEIGEGTIIGPHVVVKGPTKIGRCNKIYQFSTIGEDTPDLKYKGEATTLVIGDHNVIREGVTLHRGTVQDRAETTIGDHNLLMAYVHVGHDCVIGNNCIFVNNASVSGHVVVGDWAILSGYAMVHQRVKIGAHSFLGAAAYANQDVPAYVLVAGQPAQPKTINAEGLRRRGFSKEQIIALQRAYKVLYRKGLSLSEAVAQLEIMAADEPVVTAMLESVKFTERGIIR